MTESKEQPRCTAQLRFQTGGPYPCTLDTGHVGLHRDAEGDEWEITWSSAPELEPSTRRYEQRWTELYERHGSNRDAMTRALFDGLGELEKRMTALEDRISEGLSSLEKRMVALEHQEVHPPECHGEICVRTYGHTLKSPGPHVAD